jgi:hypothetical protein
MPGFMDCDGEKANGCEVGVVENPLSCGGCGTECSAGMACVGGKCIKVDCALKATPENEVAFGDVRVGIVAGQNIRFENTGTQACTVSKTRFVDEAGDWFSLPAVIDYPVAIQPGAAWELGVACTPKAPGDAPEAGGYPDPNGLYNLLNVQTSDSSERYCQSKRGDPGRCFRLTCRGVP